MTAPASSTTCGSPRIQDISDISYGADISLLGLAHKLDSINSKADAVATTGIPILSELRSTTTPS